MSELTLYTRNDGLFEAGDDDTMELSRKLGPGKKIVCRPLREDTGSNNMLRTWRGWMRTTGRWMAWQGATMPLCLDKDGNPYGKRPFNEHDAHDLFTHKYMGADANGNRYSWRLSNSEDDGTIPAPKEKRLFAMELHESWCAERGIKITIPGNSEYRKLKLEQIK